MSVTHDKVSYSFLTEFVDSTDAELYWIEEGTNYRVYAELNGLKLTTAVNSGTSEFTDFEANYKNQLSNRTPRNTKVLGGTTGETVGNDGDRLKVVDVAITDGASGAITVGTSAVEVKVGASPLPNRRYVTVLNKGNQTIYWGYSSSVTTSSGTDIYKNQFIEIPVGLNARVWLISGSSGQNVRIGEL